MYKFALAAGMVAVASAIQLQNQMVWEEDPFADYELYKHQGAGRHPCCDLPDCADHCPPPETPKPPVEIDINIPPEVQKVEMNMNALLTHILHEQHPDPDPLDPVIPEPGSPNERNFIENVVSPMVIQLTNNDISPALPTCRFPHGETRKQMAEELGVPVESLDDEEMLRIAEEKKRSKAAHRGKHGNDGMGDLGATDSEFLLREMLQNEMAGVDLPEGIDVRDLIDATVPSQEILDKLNVDSDEGTKVLNDIIKGFRTVVAGHKLHQGEAWHELDPRTSADDVKVEGLDLLSGDNEARGVFATDNYKDSDVSAE